MTTINPYQICLFGTLNSGTKRVIISNTKTSLNMKNDVRVRPKTTSFSNRETEGTTPESKTKITNKLKIEKSFSISGHLVQGQFYYNATQQETYTSAIDKYDVIITLIESGKTLSVIYRGRTYTGAIRQLTIDEIGTQIDAATASVGIVVYDITIDFIVGVDRLAAS